MRRLLRGLLVAHILLSDVFKADEEEEEKDASSDVMEVMAWCKGVVQGLDWPAVLRLAKTECNIDAGDDELLRIGCTDVGLLSALDGLRAVLEISQLQNLVCPNGQVFLLAVSLAYAREQLTPTEVARAQVLLWRALQTNFMLDASVWPVKTHDVLYMFDQLPAPLRLGSRAASSLDASVTLVVPRCPPELVPILKERFPGFRATVGVLGKADESAKLLPESWQGFESAAAWASQGRVGGVSGGGIPTSSAFNPAVFLVAQIAYAKMPLGRLAPGDLDPEALRPVQGPLASEESFFALASRCTAGRSETDGSVAAELVRNTFIDVVVQDEDDEPLFRSSSDPSGGQRQMQLKKEAAPLMPRLETTEEASQEEEQSSDCRLATWDPDTDRMPSAQHVAVEASASPTTTASDPAPSSDDGALFRTTAVCPKLSEALGNIDHARTAPALTSTMPAVLPAPLPQTLPAGPFGYLTNPMFTLPTPILMPANMQPQAIRLSLMKQKLNTRKGGKGPLALRACGVECLGRVFPRPTVLPRLSCAMGGKNKSNSRNFILAADAACHHF
ncbi:unnamed protein product [Symbiodinium natans]|uniref:Uncharacterized protein n=1 Tax=Symbiodinium natans TaxID=878477 RepID=A0A812QX26_9DINO|nr:unnamed protein product [Symbiodinium natans]